MPVTAFCKYGAQPDRVTRRKPQHWFALTSGEPFAFAGIWRHTDSGPRFAFLTCVANVMVGAVHPKAMPVMVAGADLDVWLRADWGKARQRVQPFDDTLMIEVAQDGAKDASTPQHGFFG